MNPVTATAGEVHRFLADMTATHGHIHLEQDEGYPLNIECDGQRLASRQALESLQANRLVKVHGFISLGAQRGSYSLQRVFRDWQKGEAIVSCIAFIPQDRIQEFEKAVLALGGKLPR